MIRMNLEHLLKQALLRSTGGLKPGRAALPKPDPDHGRRRSLGYRPRQAPLCPCLPITNGVDMTEAEHQQVIDELQGVIDDTQHTIDRFEATGMDEQMPEDYGKLLDILDDAVKQQREHVMVMLLV